MNLLTPKIKDNQEAFKYGATEEFGLRDIGMFRKEIKNDKYDKPDKFDKEV